MSPGRPFDKLWTENISTNENSSQIDYNYEPPRTHLYAPIARRHQRQTAGSADEGRTATVPILQVERGLRRRPAASLLWAAVPPGNGRAAARPITHSRPLAQELAGEIDDVVGDGAVLVHIEDGIERRLPIVPKAALVFAASRRLPRPPRVCRLLSAPINIVAITGNIFLTMLLSRPTFAPTREASSRLTS
jgi:hypothetical protein